MIKKSAVKEFRKILGKGKTGHSGRGFYEMETSFGPTELVERLNTYAAKYPEKVQDFKTSKSGAKLVLVDGYGRGFGENEDEAPYYYKTLIVNFRSEGAIVAML
jgi:hypothetical protein